MIASQQMVETKLRASPKWVIAMLVALGLMSVFISDSYSDSFERLQGMLFTILLYTLAACIWLLNDWRPGIARWFAVMALVVMVNLGVVWLGMPGFLSLATIPAAVAAALIGLPAAIVTAIGETILLLLLPGYSAAAIEPAAIIMSLIAVWMTVGIMAVVYHYTNEITRWSWEHFQQARTLLEQTRDHKAELEQALADLAHANRELMLLNERVAAMRLIAEEAQKTKTVFVAKVSHEFRTPLNMIIGLTDILTETPEIYGDELSPALLEDLKIVHRNCEHLASLVNDVLDLSQTDMGHLTLRREWVDLAEDIDSALLVVRPLLEKKRLSLRTIIPDNLPKIYCDRTRIRQVILNLVSNATRFTERGGITVQIAPQDRYLVISITDTGPGIAPEDARIIFEPFCQGLHRLGHDRGGSGLGLSISKQFVELHNGQIWLESQPGIGSTFSFKLPISPPTPSAARPDRWISEDWVWHERTAKPKIPTLPFRQRIIICDETGDLYALLADHFEETEFIDTRTMAQAELALQQHPAHAVIVNTVSPNNLWPLVERARREIVDIPIIACAFPPQIKHVLEAGAVDYLIKPVRRARLIEAIQTVGRPVKQILIVDDDPEVQQLFARMLATHDETMEVRFASSGSQALEELRRKWPDLMLLDIAMPNLDGWQTLELKNQDETMREIPTIIISAQDPTEQPLISTGLLATMGQGLSLTKLLRCSLALSTLLLKPEGDLVQSLNELPPPNGFGQIESSA
jgi:signal transduction histidine kinase/DNA-binding response OmpR family regulator